MPSCSLPVGVFSFCLALGLLLLARCLSRHQTNKLFNNIKTFKTISLNPLSPWEAAKWLLNLSHVYLCSPSSISVTFLSSPKINKPLSSYLHLNHSCICFLSMDFLYLLINLLDFTLDLQGIKSIAWWAWNCNFTITGVYLVCNKVLSRTLIFRGQSPDVLVHAEFFSKFILIISLNLKVIPTRAVLFCLLLCFNWNRVNSSLVLEGAVPLNHHFTIFYTSIIRHLHMHLPAQRWQQNCYTQTLNQLWELILIAF